MLHALKLSWTLITAIVAVAVLAACGTATGESHGGKVRDHVSFVDQWRANGVTVDIAGTASQPFLRPGGTRLRLTGGTLGSAAEIESYNYDSTDLGADGAQIAKDDASGIAADGTPKKGTAQWTGPVHFYRADRVIVLYVGSDPATTKLLTELLGPQFAGA
jgi:hypothetical protein